MLVANIEGVSCEWFVSFSYSILCNPCRCSYVLLTGVMVRVRSMDCHSYEPMEFQSKSSICIYCHKIIFRNASERVRSYDMAFRCVNIFRLQ